MKTADSYLEESSSEAILVREALSMMEDNDYPDNDLGPAPVAREYIHGGLGIGSVIRLDDLQPTQHERLATLVHVGSAIVVNATPGLVAREADWRKAYLVDWPAGAKHRLVQRHAVWPGVPLMTGDIVGPASRVFQWNVPSKVEATYVAWFAEKKPGVNTQKDQLVKYEELTHPEESGLLYQRSFLTPLVAIRNTLKLMALILWNSVCHPLTESVVDYERVTVYAKPIDTQEQ